MTHLPRFSRRALTPRRALTAVLVLVVTLLAAPASAAGPDPGALSPPDPYFPGLGNRGIDVAHYDLSFAYEPGSGNLRGTATLDITATRRLARFNLDLTDMTVHRVTVDGVRAQASRTAGELVVRPATPIARGKKFAVRVRYSGLPAPSLIPGLRASNGWLPTTDGAVSLDEPQGASTWFPGNDHPSDKATFTFRINVPSPLVAVANGTLQGKDVVGDRTIWTWSEDAPMTTYLTQVAIGDLVIDDQPAAGTVAIRNVYAPRVQAAASKAAAETPAMLDFLSSWFGPFPFSVYGIVVPAEGPQGLAFEAQTLTLVAPDVFASPSTSSAILAHELTHQWFGDWVSPARWNEVWLNEGFATYGEWLWTEKALGVPVQVSADRARSAIGDSTTATDNPGRDDMFGYAPYERGGLVLHALRTEVGDEMFKRILATYLERFGGKSATTADFVKVCSDVAGRDLAPFLRSWLGPGRLPS